MEDKDDRENWCENLVNNATYIALDPNQLCVFLTTHLHRGPGSSEHYAFSMFFSYNLKDYLGGYTDGLPVTCVNWEYQYFMEDIKDVELKKKWAEEDISPIQWSDNGANCSFPELVDGDELDNIFRTLSCEL